MQLTGRLIAALLLLATMAGAVFVLASMASLPAHGQVTSNVNLVPDCLLVFNFAATGSSVSFDNRQRGCTSWAVTYMAYGFGAVSLLVQSSADNVGVPAGFVAFAGSILSGINPNVDLAQNASSFSGYYPWVRVDLTVAGGPGNVKGILYGFKEKIQQVVLTIPPGVTVPVVGAGAAGVAPVGLPVLTAWWDLAVTRIPVTDTTGRPIVVGQSAVGVVAAGNPLQTGMVDPATGFPLYVRGNTNGLQIQGPINSAVAANANPVVIGGVGSGAAPGMVAPTTVCDLSAPITLAAAAGATQIVALAAARSIRVCHLSLSMTAPVDINLIYGTGANCVAGPTNVTGVYSTVLAVALDFVNGPVVVPAAQALCVNLGQAVAGGGMVTYALY